MSFISRLWNAVRNPVRYVGRDLEGNKFYETRSLNDSSYMKRTVQYFDSEEVWRYIGGGKRLPIQWSAWLTHTRKDPPTVEELQADVLRQQRVLENVARIEARDRAESEQMLRMRQQDAQLALADASANARGEPVLAEPSRETAVPESVTAEAVPVPLTAEVAEKTKVRPPSFLTPSAPRKGKSSAPFALPSLPADEIASPAESAPSPAPTAEASSSPWVSKPQETESWTPKAVRRG